MSRVSDAQYNESMDQLGEFRRSWMESPDYPQENFGNTRVVYPEVEVMYSSGDPVKVQSFTTEMVVLVMSGPDDGCVQLNETSRHRHGGEIHLYFKPEFQRYAYNEADHSLEIYGTSSRTGERYTARIMPQMSRAS